MTFCCTASRPIPACTVQRLYTCRLLSFMLLLFFAVTDRAASASNRSSLTISTASSLSAACNLDGFVKDAAYLQTLSICTADPLRCCASSSTFCAEQYGCCYSFSEKCNPDNVRLVPYVCTDARTNKVVKVARHCQCSVIASAQDHLTLPPKALRAANCSADEVATPLRATKPVLKEDAKLREQVTTPGQQCAAEYATALLAWTTMVQACAKGARPCCSLKGMIGEEGACMYEWFKCKPDHVKLRPLKCVDGVNNVVQVANVSNGECGCDRSWVTVGPAQVPVVFISRDPSCAANAKPKVEEGSLFVKWYKIIEVLFRCAVAQQWLLFAFLIAYWIWSLLGKRYDVLLSYCEGEPLLFEEDDATTLGRFLKAYVVKSMNEKWQVMGGFGNLSIFLEGQNRAAIMKALLETRGGGIVLCAVTGNYFYSRECVAVLNQAAKLCRLISDERIRLHVVCVDLDASAVEDELSRTVGLEGINVWPVATNGHDGPDIVGGQVAERIVQCLLDNCTVAGSRRKESFENLLRVIDELGPAAGYLASFFGLGEGFFSRMTVLRTAQERGLISPRAVGKLEEILNKDEGLAYVQSYIGKWCSEWSTKDWYHLFIRCVRRMRRLPRTA